MRDPWLVFCGLAWLSITACDTGADPAGVDGAPADTARPGSPCAGEEDWEIDGVVDVRWRYYEDQRGRDVRDEGHHDGDGMADNVWEYDWTDAGQLAGKRWLLRAELWFSQETRFDDAGRPVEQRTDGDGDGAVPPDTRTYRYQGARLVEEATDGSSDGVIDQRRRYEYGATDMVALVRVDEEDDGSIDKHEVHSYDASQWLSRIEYDHPVGGAIEDVERFTWDEGGRLVEQVRDNGQDGALDYRWTAAYDGEGRLLERSVDTDGDGPWAVQVTRHEYDEQGRLSSVKTTGFHESSLVLQYDCADAADR